MPSVVSDPEGVIIIIIIKCFWCRAGMPTCDRRIAGASEETETV